MSISGVLPKTVLLGDRQPILTPCYDGPMTKRDPALEAKERWCNWIAERDSFPPPGFRSFQEDLEVLEGHITRMITAAPRNKDGSLHATAARQIDRLERELAKAHRWIGDKERTG